MTRYFYVSPTDSLFIRGNLAFGDGGEHGSSLMPPPPSLFAGAFRSAMLGRDAANLAAFIERGRCDDPLLHECLGSVDQPGTFRLTWLSLAGRRGEAEPEPVFALPSDLLQSESGLALLEPQPLAASVASYGELPLRATLRASEREKPLAGTYLRQNGMRKHLSGELPLPADAIAASGLHARDPRLGIGLSAEAGSAEAGMIYTTEGFAFGPPLDPVFESTGFLVGLDGTGDILPESGMLRLGGDGRSAHYQQFRCLDVAAPAVEALQHGARFRLLLRTPGLFRDGWLPPGVDLINGQYRLTGNGFAARLACAAVGRREIVSGWDLFRGRPKDAEAAAPAGSVYWFDEFEGDAGKLAEWVAGGLWGNEVDVQRRAEGYNLGTLGSWN